MNMVNSEHHLSATMVTGRTHRMTEMIARLAPGATVQQARAEVGGDHRRACTSNYPEAYDAGSGYHVTLTPFQEVLGQKAQLTLWLLMGAAAFVLIIACANVANLTLMRGVRREHELVVRAALGAGTARLRRLLLVENLLLALMGGALGLVIAFGGVRMLIALRGALQPARGRDSHRRHRARRSRCCSRSSLRSCCRSRRRWRSERYAGASLAAGGDARPAACVASGCSRRWSSRRSRCRSSC